MPPTRAARSPARSRGHQTAPVVRPGLESSFLWEQKKYALLQTVTLTPVLFAALGYLMPNYGVEWPVLTFYSINFLFSYATPLLLYAVINPAAIQAHFNRERYTVDEEALAVHAATDVSERNKVTETLLTPAYFRTHRWHRRAFECFRFGVQTVVFAHTAPLIAGMPWPRWEWKVLQLVDRFFLTVLQLVDRFYLTQIFVACEAVTSGGPSFAGRLNLAVFWAALLQLGIVANSPGLVGGSSAVSISGLSNSEGWWLLAWIALSAVFQPRLLASACLSATHRLVSGDVNLISILVLIFVFKVWPVLQKLWSHESKRTEILRLAWVEAPPILREAWMRLHRHSALHAMLLDEASRKQGGFSLARGVYERFVSELRFGDDEAHTQGVEECLCPETRGRSVMYARAARGVEGLREEVERNGTDEDKGARRSRARRHRPMTLSVLWCPDPDPDPRRHGPLSAARFALLASVCAECLHYVLDMEAGATELAFQNGKRDCNENGELLDSRKEFIQVNGIIGGRTRGKRLEDFHRHPDAQKAKLSMEEVAALRLYTTAAFKSINTPLREQGRRQPHPLAATVWLIHNAVKKLRVAHRTRKSQTLWRGMKHVAVKEQFFEDGGGTEFAPMSTTSELAVAMDYAAADHAVLLQIHVENHLTLGANVEFLSAFPRENEILYPPLTYLQPIDGTKPSLEYMEVGGMQIQVVDVKPVIA